MRSTRSYRTTILTTFLLYPRVLTRRLVMRRCKYCVLSCIGNLMIKNEPRPLLWYFLKNKEITCGILFPLRNSVKMLRVSATSRAHLRCRSGLTF